MRKEVLLILDRFLLILFPYLFLPLQKKNKQQQQGVGKFEKAEKSTEMP